MAGKWPSLNTKVPLASTKDRIYLTTYTIWCVEMISNLSNVFVSTTRSMIIIVKTSDFAFDWFI